jgi:hypothetical protein
MNLVQPFVDYLVQSAPRPDDQPGVIRILQRVAISGDLRRRYLRAWADAVGAQPSAYDLDQASRAFVYAVSQEGQ